MSSNFRITLPMLKKNGACIQGYRAFKGMFGTSAPLTSENILKALADTELAWGIDWAIKYLLPDVVCMMHTDMDGLIENITVEHIPQRVMFRNQWNRCSFRNSAVVNFNESVFINCHFYGCRFENVGKYEFVDCTFEHCYGLGKCTVCGEDKGAAVWGLHCAEEVVYKCIHCKVKEEMNSDSGGRP